MIGFLFVSSSYAQLAYTKTNKNDKKKYAKAQSFIDDYNYSAALDVYKEIVSTNPDDYFVYTQIGYCYLNLGDGTKAVENLTKSTDYFRKNNQLKKAYGTQALYYLAESNYITYNFIDAKTNFQELLTFSNKKQRDLLVKKIKQCDSAQYMYEHPVGVFVVQPNIINSPAPDYCPVVTADNSKLFFTSRRSGSTGGNIDYDGYSYEDIYSVDINNDNFSAPVNMGPPINTDGHEATSSISPDGNELFIYRSSRKDPGDIYYSTRNGNQWSEPVRLDAPINSKHLETHASLSPDGNLLYFTSDRNKGKGGLDIYVAEKDDDGKWSNVQNIGILNTDGNEEGPFVSPDGNTLYFSSDGRIGMGGYDIYKSEKQDDGSWGTPINLGFPLNTVNDDIFYVPTANPATAYYSSKQFTGISQIYVVQVYSNMNNMIFVKGNTYDASADTLLIVQSKTDSVKINNIWYPSANTKTYGNNDSIYITVAKGSNFIDSICKIPNQTQILVYDVDETDKTGPYRPQYPNGKYGIAIDPVEEKLISFEAPNHIYDILHIYPKPGVVTYTAQLDTIVEGTVKNVKYSEFELEGEDLSDYQNKEFDILADFLNNNPNLFVDISSYGYKEIPEAFDADRTNTITQYLVDKGVNQDRIYNGLSPNNISGQLVEYTIYDKTTLQDAIDDKNNNQNVASVTVTNGLLITDINFDLNKSTNPDYFDDLDVVANYLKDNPDAKIGIYGYTDTQGNANYNKKLSKKRADFVSNYLISKGASANQIVADGKGFSKQVSKNRDQNGNYIWNSLGYNRRVEIVVLDQGSKSKLFVKPVDVPQNYQIPSNDMDYLYSVMVTVSETQLPNSAFNFSVSELKGVDNLYNYIHGEFQTEQKAQDFVNDVVDKYPKAYVFINNFRK